MSAKLPLTDEERDALAAGDYRIDRWQDRLAVETIHPSLPRAWRPLVPHPEQVRLARSDARFKIIGAGRRSGKTMRALRHLVRAAMGPQSTPDAFYFYAAPTRDQGKRIAWEAIKQLVPRWARDPRKGRDGISDGELTVHLLNGATIAVVGMDRPQRIEGIAGDGAVLDEYAEMKPEAWTSSVRPALDTPGRPGWAWFVGRPRGKNHFYELVREFGQNPAMDEWDYFHWKSADLAHPDTIAAAKRDLDVLTFSQEYEADFVNPEGRVYYAFDWGVHCTRLAYNPTLPLYLCFDFNVDPGVCAYIQEQPCLRGAPFASTITAVLGEVWIPKNSNTPAVCDAILRDWGPQGAIANHQGEVYLYGDPAGGARGTAQVEGSDWDLIRAKLRPWLGGRYRDRVEREAPKVKARVNCVNSRLRAADGTVKMLIDEVRAPHVAQDFQDVTWKDGTFEIDKPSGTMLSHLSDGIGYFIAAKYPVYELTAPSVRPL